jgi:hypothetical protein
VRVAAKRVAYFKASRELSSLLNGTTGEVGDGT